VNEKLIEDIANAVLYEGYMLYPYRPSSVKNRQRWNFGVVYPEAYSQAQKGADSCFQRTECLVLGTADTALSVKVRFLQAVARTIGEVTSPIDELPTGAATAQEPTFRTVNVLQVGNQIFQTWQEASEREIVLPSLRLGEIAAMSDSQEVVFPAGRELEAVHDAEGRTAGVIVRTKSTIAAKVDIVAEPLENGLFKLSVRVANITGMTNDRAASREEALMHSLLSAHTILQLRGGEFVSYIDPPASMKTVNEGCNNIGTWPVLAGEQGQFDCVLSSPIILYDYPQIAPESPGNLFDGTEIDEILALRILTLTDAEKNEMRQSDERSRQVLERTEAMPAEHFMKLHGALRGLRAAGEEQK
jgi:hypothetical protein